MPFCILPDFLFDYGRAMFLSNMFFNQIRYQTVIIQMKWNTEFGHLNRGDIIA